jgi:NRPS condensation-like uncharacterized protein
MKRVSLANLAANAPASPITEPAKGAKKKRVGRKSSSEKVNKTTSDNEGSGDQRVQVAFRMDKDAYKDLKRQALDEDATVNDLILEAINQLRSQKGLKKLSA